MILGAFDYKQCCFVSLVQSVSSCIRFTIIHAFPTPIISLACEVSILRSFQCLFAFLLLGSLPIAWTSAAEKRADEKPKPTASVFDGPRIDAGRQGPVGSKSP